MREDYPQPKSKTEASADAAAVYERFAVTPRENDRILAVYFPDGLDESMSAYPPKEKRRFVILRHLIRQFEFGRIYRETEINGVLARYHDDYWMLRRELIDFGFLDRTADGSAYWVKHQYQHP